MIIRYKILHRYILKEFIFPFTFGLATFTFLYIGGSLLFRISQMLTEKKASWILALRFLIFSLPQIFVHTFPMAVLLGSLLAINRLSSDTELVALKAAGISFYRISLSIFIVSWIIFIITYLLNENIVPPASFEARKILMQVFSDNKLKEASRNLVFRNFTEEGIERVTYAQKYDFDKGVMSGVVVSEFEGDRPLRTTYAEKAIWSGTGWELIKGNTYNYNQAREVDYEFKFTRLKMTIPYTPREISEIKIFPEEMKSKAVREYIKELKRVNLPSGYIEVMYNQRLALPFSCVVFSLIGLPFGVTPQRSSTPLGLGVSLVIIFIFYIVTIFFTTLGYSGKLDPLLASWVANIIFLGIGISLIYKKER